MIDEDLLRRAAAKASEKQTKLLEVGYDPENQHVFSETFERKIKRLTRRADHFIFYRITRSAASILAALLLAGSFWLMFDIKARAALIGWMKDTYKGFFTYEYSGPEVGSAPVRYHLSYVPEGYTEVFSDYSDGEGTTLHIDDAGNYLQFSYITDPDNSSFQIDTTNTQHHRVAVNKNSADYFEALTSAVSSCILWMDAENQYLFYVAGYFDQAQLIHIAENVEILKN